MMHKINFKTVLFLCFAVMISIFPGCRTKKYGMAPDFQLSQLDGKTLSLVNYKGKVVLLNFWATWCVTCKQEIPLLNSLFLKYSNKNFIIVGISIDKNLDQLKTFIKDNKMEFPIAVGDTKIQKIYKVTGVPESYLIDINGKIVETYIGIPRASVLEKDIADMMISQKK